jgi:predicted enzyme related to lactoylglutathione lyase
MCKLLSCLHQLELMTSADGFGDSPKTDIGGDMGYFARFIDTEGNLQGIWAAK